MNISSPWLRHFLAALIAILSCCSLAHADDLDGTWWRLVMRKLPDGTTLTPPAVYGASTSKDGVRFPLFFAFQAIALMPPVSSGPES